MPESAISHYGEGAAEVLMEIDGTPSKGRDFIDEDLRPGDIERIAIEWRSILRQVAHSPDYKWPRWQALKKAAASQVSRHKKEILLESLPPLTPEQKVRRKDWRRKE